MKRRANVRWLPTVIALGAVAVGAIVLAQTGKQAPASPKVEVNTDRSSAPAVQVTPAVERKPLAYYMAGVRSDLFSEPLPPAPKPKPEPPKVTAPPPPPPPAPAPVNPFADYAYTGTVTIDGQLMALVENTKTKEGQYLKAGDSFLGGTVSGVDERTLTIHVAGTDQRLAKTDNFSLTPLDKSAPYLTAQPAQPGQPGAPGQAGPGGLPQAGPGGSMPPAFQGLPPRVQQRMMERMQNMTPEERQRMQERFLNRQFEGGGRRGRGGGFGGFGGGFGF